MSVLLADSCLSKHQVETEQHKHSFGVVFNATSQMGAKLVILLLIGLHQLVREISSPLASKCCLQQLVAYSVCFLALSRSQAVVFFSELFVVNSCCRPNNADRTLRVKTTKQWAERC